MWSQTAGTGQKTKKYILCLFIGTIPALIIGLSAKSFILLFFESIKMVSFSLIFTGVILFLSIKRNNKKSKIIKMAVNNKETVAVRIPKHKIARNLLNILKVPLAAPSANISSRLSPTSAKDVIDEFKNKLKFKFNNKIPIMIKLKTLIFPNQIRKL